jgi:hypothetical protein
MRFCACRSNQLPHCFVHRRTSENRLFAKAIFNPAGFGRPLSRRHGPASGVRSANRGADQTASTTEQDRRNDASMRVLVSFGPEGSADSEADECSDQGMAPVASLPRHSSISPPAGISHLGWNRGNGPMLGKVGECLAIARTCNVFVLNVCTTCNQHVLRSLPFVCSLPLSGLRRSARQHTVHQEKRGE